MNSTYHDLTWFVNSSGTLVHHQFKFSPVTSFQVHVLVWALPIVLSESHNMTSVQHSESEVVRTLTNCQLKVTNVLKQVQNITFKKNSIWKCTITAAAVLKILYSEQLNSGLLVTIMQFNQVFWSIWQYFSQQILFARLSSFCFLTSDLHLACAYVGKMLQARWEAFFTQIFPSESQCHYLGEICFYAVY